MDLGKDLLKPTNSSFFLRTSGTLWTSDPSQLSGRPALYSRPVFPLQNNIHGFSSLFGRPISERPARLGRLVFLPQNNIYGFLSLSGRPVFGRPTRLGHPVAVCWFMAYEFPAVGRLMSIGRPDIFVPPDSGVVRTSNLFCALKWLKRLLFPHPLYIGFSLPRDEVYHSL